MGHHHDYVLRTLEERKVHLVRLWFCDVLGQLKSVAISPVELETAFEDGIQFDGSAVDGFSRVQESDVLAMPDPSSFQLMTWGDGEVSARMFCDIVHLDGTPFEGDPRQVLKRNLQRARDRGFELMCAPEVEYFYLASDDPSQPPQTLDNGSYFDLTTSDIASDIRRATIHQLENTGIPVEYSFHEDAPSQHEIDLRYDDALAMADAIMTLRVVVKEVAYQHGVHATFMPKPIAGVQGSGMHTHISLFRDEENAFYDSEGDANLSEVARQFIAGLLRHAPEITAVTNQLVNFGWQYIWHCHILSHEEMDMKASAVWLDGLLRARKWPLMGGEVFDSTDFASIPVHQAMLAAGGGRINDTEDRVGYLAFRRDWLLFRGYQWRGDVISSAEDLAQRDYLSHRK